MANHKYERISSDIHKYLSNILLTETRDDLLKSITITDVSVTKDLGMAKIYFTSISELSHKDIEKEMKEASSYLRGRLAKVLNIRSIPLLNFIYDESVEHASRIEKIISEIHKKED